MNEFDNFLESLAQEIVDNDQMEKKAASIKGAIEGAKGAFSKVKKGATEFGKDVMGRKQELKDIGGYDTNAEVIRIRGNRDKARAKLGLGIGGAAVAGGVAGVAHNKMSKDAFDGEDAIEVTASQALLQASYMREAALETLFESQLLKQAAEEVLYPLAKEAGLID